VSSSTYPIPPHVRIRVGVTGHRGPPKLPADAVAPVRAVLDRIVAVVADEGTKAENAYKAYASATRDQTAASAGDFVVISSLAEGADRLVAEAGLAAGFALEAVLPFHRAEYSRDFESPESRTAFEGLLRRSSAVFELDGQRADSPRAYEAAGFIMLANTDLLIVIWDGKPAAGVGGTAEIISRAIAEGIPVVWVEPANPAAMRLSWSPAGSITTADAAARPQDTFRPADEAGLALAIGEILAPPTSPQAQESLKQYLRTRERRWNFCPWYSLLSRLFAGRPLRRSDFHLPPAVPDTQQQWRDYLGILPQDRAQRLAIDHVLLPACGIPDHLATYYSLVYRSTYTINFLSAALAVTVALIGIFIHDPHVKSYFVSTELAVIVAILLTWLCGHWGQWHRRWLECRRLAESLRHLRIFAPLASAGSIPRPRRGLHHTEEDWIDWYAWSVRRQLPLPDRVVDSQYLEAIRDAVRRGEMAGQIQYHQRNALQMAKLDHRIHLSGQVLFATTAGLCIAFVCLVWFGLLDEMGQSVRDLLLSSLTFLTALLPTLGAALAAIHAQGDFKTVAEQSARTAQRLAAIDKILAAEEPSFGRLLDRIEKISEVLMADLREWHTVFQTRQLALPA